MFQLSIIRGNMYIITVLGSKARLTIRSPQPLGSMVMANRPSYS